MAEIFLDPSRLDHYELFLKVKSLPRYSFQGHTASFPDEYLERLGLGASAIALPNYVPSSFLFDYQRDISALAIRKKRFAIFAQCGLGKSLMLLEYARYVASILPPAKRVLIVSPLMVVSQTISEATRFYNGDLPLEQVRARDLPSWLNTGTSRIGITNYEAITDTLSPANLGALILDESSMLKHHDATYARRLIELGRELDYKLCLTGTPAPNDRIEYANHAVFLGQFPTTNSFLSRYFVNRGQTNERWELKPHALRPFYRALSHWCIFLENPATYGWRDNVNTIPPIHVHIHDVDLTPEQTALVRTVSKDLFGSPGGITSRSKLSQLAKGRANNKPVPTNKPDYIRDLIATWQDTESTILWCRFNHEQDAMEAVLPGSGSIRGETPEDKRLQIIRDFQEGRTRILISKPEVLGYGLNLQIATRQVHNGLHDSAEKYIQATKRSNRIGSTKPLNVHIPITSIEQAMADTVLRKLKRINQDIAEQEALFKEVSIQ